MFYLCCLFCFALFYQTFSDILSRPSGFQDDVSNLATQLKNSSSTRLNEYALLAAVVMATQ